MEELWLKFILKEQMVMVKKVYVVEDMAISRAALIEMLEDNGFEVVGSSASADRAWIEIKQQEIDILLLDINLVGEYNGIWLAKMVRKHKDTPLIFLTAYGDEDTLRQLQEVEPNGYLMKPYNEPTLITMIDIAIRSFKVSERIKLNGIHSPSVSIRENGLTIKLSVDEIFYAKSDGNYLEIIARDKKHIIREKLSVFLSKLPPELFVQVHRRYFVNVKRIDVYSPGLVVVNEHQIPVSKTYKEGLAQKFNE